MSWVSLLRLSLRLAVRGPHSPLCVLDWEHSLVDCVVDCVVVDCVVRVVVGVVVGVDLTLHVADFPFDVLDIAVARVHAHAHVHVHVVGEFESFQ